MSKLQLAHQYLNEGLSLDQVARLLQLEVKTIPVEWHPKPVELKNYMFPPQPAQQRNNRRR